MHPFHQLGVAEYLGSIDQCNARFIGNLSLVRNNRSESQTTATNSWPEEDHQHRSRPRILWTVDLPIRLIQQPQFALLPQRGQ